MKYYSAKTYEMMSFAGKGMELEIVTLIELKPVQKDKYHVFVHTWILDPPK
jgi:hypothetical protein